MSIARETENILKYSDYTCKRNVNSFFSACKVNEMFIITVRADNRAGHGKGENLPKKYGSGKSFLTYYPKTPIIIQDMEKEERYVCAESRSS